MDYQTEAARQHEIEEEALRRFKRPGSAEKKHANARGRYLKALDQKRTQERRVHYAENELKHAQSKLEDYQAREDAAERALFYAGEVLAHTEALYTPEKDSGATESDDLPPAAAGKETK